MSSLDSIAPRRSILAGLCASLILGCAHRGTEGARSVEAPPVTEWADQFGAVLAEAQACVRRHRGGDAVVVGIRVLSTGEIGILTRGSATELVACVHDGHRVVHRAPSFMDPRELKALPFVTLGFATPPPSDGYQRTRALYWGSSFVGWLTKRTCGPEPIHRSP